MDQSDITPIEAPDSAPTDTTSFSDAAPLSSIQSDDSSSCFTADDRLVIQSIGWINEMTETKRDSLVSESKKVKGLDDIYKCFGSLNMSRKDATK